MLVAHHLPPDGFAGVERVAQSLGGELEALGDSVSFVTRRVGETGHPRRLDERLPNGSAHIRLAGGKRPLEKFLLHHERLEREFTSALLELDPDVVHVHHLFGLSPRFIEIAYRLRIPVVVSLHDFYFACPLINLRKRSGEICDGPDGGLECARTCFAGEGPDGVVRWGLRTAYFRALLDLPERFISPSRHMAAFFERFGVAPGRVKIVDNAVAVPRIEAGEPRTTPGARGRLNLAYLGTVAEHKGIHVLIEALRLAGLPASTLLVGGTIADPGYVRRLQDAAARVPGLELDLVGAYEVEEVPKLLRDVDCLVIPSQWPETFAIVAREAFVRGVPVAVARIGGLQEAVQEGENGFSFAPDRPDELAKILRRLARDDALLERLRRGALASKVCSPREHAIDVRGVYGEAIERAAHGSRRSADTENLRFLHQGSLEAGFASV
jgi:glycosyltransferase involved in cell wall biosynthesis